MYCRSCGKDCDPKAVLVRAELGGGSSVVTTNISANGLKGAWVKVVTKDAVYEKQTQASVVSMGSASLLSSSRQAPKPWRDQQA